MGRRKEMLESTEERFWAKVNKDGQVTCPELGQCWEWTAAKSKKSGRFRGDSGAITAHRYSYILHGGTPSQLIVFHRCKNNFCVNPSHLRAGTAADKYLYDYQERFWAYVNKDGACWEWTGVRNDYGYGLFGFGGRVYRSHRFAYQLTYGEFPKAICVLHRCDNPPCVRPDHLFLGTKLDNILDMRAKGRANDPTGDRSGARKHPESRPRGEQAKRSKLKTDQVLSIYRRYHAGDVSIKALAREFGVSHIPILNIIHKRGWRHVLEKEQVRP